MTAAQLAIGAASPAARRGPRIRRFTAADIPQVAAVHQAAFRVNRSPDEDGYRDYFKQVFIDHPANDDRITSLVYEEHDGRITGFVGLVPRRVAINGRRYLAAFSSQFVVDPDSHVGLVALRLAKAYLEGPQDLSVADEANDVSQRIWHGLGGDTARLLSLYWTRALRPARLATTYLRQRRGFATVATAAGPLADLADAVATRLPGSHFRQLVPAVDTEDLRGAGALHRALAFTDQKTLRVDYDARTFAWLLDRVGRRSADGQLLAAVVTRGSATLGWYVAHLDRDGVADVARLAATPASIDAVLDHLFNNAWRQGAVSVTGRLDARFMQALSDKYCLFHRRGPWMLIKSNQPDILNALHTGATSLSPLDGEWSLRYHP